MGVTVRLVCVVVAVVAVCGEAAVVGARQEEQNEGELWAVLVAGSTGWFNYRHQVRN